jgi:hypothetical protein
MKITIPDHLSDDDLMAELSSAADREREVATELIAHLAEIESRGLYRGLGFTSLYTYCVEALRLSEDEAHEYVEAVRALGAPRT